MKKSFLALLMFLLAFMSCNENKNPARVLVFSKTTGYRHASIAKGKVTIQNLGKQNGFAVRVPINDPITHAVVGETCGDTTEGRHQKYIAVAVVIGREGDGFSIR